MIDIVKVIILSLVEGFTEFLPISSTGHLILVSSYLQLDSIAFTNRFNVIIQLGAIMAVVVLYFHRLFPIKNATKKEQKQALQIWKRVIIGMIPAALLIPFDDFIDTYLFQEMVVAIALLVWGIVIVFFEKRTHRYHIENVEDMSYKTAFLIGVFQCLAMVPGTSRSAATIIGAMVLGTKRKAAAEFSFFLAIPAMFGATFIKLISMVTEGIFFTAWQWSMLGLGTFLSFLVALVVIRYLIQFIQNHTFTIFGYYRIVLSVIVMAVWWIR